MPSSLALLLAMAAVSQGFPLASTLPRRASPAARTAVSMAASFDGHGRREVLAGALAAALAVPAPSLAFGNDFQRQMQGYGIKDYKQAPDGFSPVVGFYGRAVPGQDPLLVTYNSPSGWLVVRPNIDNNGEDGTVSSGDYGKGDSAALFIGPPLKGGSLADQPKEYFEKLVFAGVTQKGESMVQGFKLRKIQKLEANTETPYYLVDFTYTLLTGAGFEVNRKGTGSVTAVGDKSVQAMIGASTDVRYKKTEPLLREVAESFRVYGGVINKDVN